MADPRQAHRSMTFEEAALLDPDEQPGELDQGRWMAMTRPPWTHGEVVAEVTNRFKVYAREHPGWVVVAGNPGTMLQREPDLLRGPDVAVVRAERKPTGKGVQGWLQGAPELAVEVAGSRPLAELCRKAVEYLTAGGGMVWIVDPDARQAVVFRTGNVVQVLREDEVLEGGDVLPGFSCKVGEMLP